jgi:hypothetical protein
VQRIEELAEAGATKLWVGMSGGSLEGQKHYLRLFGEQIVTHFR